MTEFGVGVGSHPTRGSRDTLQGLTSTPSGINNEQGPDKAS